MNQIDNITYKIADILGRRNDIPFIMSLRDTMWNLRATFLRQDYDKNLLYRDSALQDLGEIELINLPPDEAKKFSHCKIKRTKYRIPNPIEIDQHNKYKYVGTSDGAPDYQPTTEFAVEHTKDEQFPNFFPSYFLKDGYMYVVNGGSYVRVIAMFQDPNDAVSFTENKGANCSTFFNAYIPKDMVDAIEKEMERKYLPKTDSAINTPKDEIKV